MIAGRLTNISAPLGRDDNVVLDCTSTERFGLRGPGTVDWLTEAGLAIPEKVNTSVTLPCGTTIIRLGEQDVLLVAASSGSGESVRMLRDRWRSSALRSKGYDAYRDESWAWFVISGPDAPALMRRISMADLRPENLKRDEVAQTRALRLDAVVVRLDRFEAPSYDIFLDIASAAFALNVLTETSAELEAGFRLAAIEPKG